MLLTRVAKRFDACISIPYGQNSHLTWLKYCNNCYDLEHDI